mmetsp:Transcript_12895/g.18960  ORF Transcript_12895/g.18960 Transcript_12895/m.18960 type:complete len:219 (-) Transcript_12895:829-1485(-)
MRCGRVSPTGWESKVMPIWILFCRLEMNLINASFLRMKISLPLSLFLLRLVLAVTKMETELPMLSMPAPTHPTGWIHKWTDKDVNHHLLLPPQSKARQHLPMHPHQWMWPVFWERTVRSISLEEVIQTVTRSNPPMALPTLRGFIETSTFRVVLRQRLLTGTYLRFVLFAFTGQLLGQTHEIQPPIKSKAGPTVRILGRYWRKVISTHKTLARIQVVQ